MCSRCWLLDADTQKKLVGNLPAAGSWHFSIQSYHSFSGGFYFWTQIFKIKTQILQSTEK
jgi:hypothetical protein